MIEFIQLAIVPVFIVISFICGLAVGIKSSKTKLCNTCIYAERVGPGWKCKNRISLTNQYIPLEFGCIHHGDKE